MLLMNIHYGRRMVIIYFVNVAGDWLKVNLKNITLISGKWRNNQKIGVINSNSITEALINEVKKAKKNTFFFPRKYITKNNDKIELAQKGLQTQFIITKKNMKPRIKWSSSLEELS